MKNKKILTCVMAVMVMLMPIWRDASAVTVVRQDGVGATASKVITPGPLLDDFRYAAPSNVWNCPTGTFSSASSPMPADAFCTASYTNDPAITYGGTGNSLQLAYNVTRSASYAGYYSKMDTGNLTSPTAYTVISFQVKGAAGGEFFKIQLKNTSTTSYSDTINNTNYYILTALGNIPCFLSLYLCHSPLNSRYQIRIIR